MNHPGNQMPGQPQRFAINVPEIGKQHQQAQQAVQAAIGQLAIQFYCPIAEKHLQDSREPQADFDPEFLREAAKDALQSAKCYFEGIGAIEK